MLTVAEALHLVLHHTQRLPELALPLGLPCLDLTLAEDVACEADSPPFAKAMVDGYAVRSADCAKRPATLEVIEEVHAGQMPQKAVQAGQTTRIMTGAPLPSGADAVVMHEVTKAGPADNMVVIADSVLPHQNVFGQGEEMKRGDKVLAAGQRIGPPELGLLVSLGRTAISVFRAPHVAVLSTGNEIIDPGQPLQPGQIRNSNAPMLMAQLSRTPSTLTSLGIARDTEASLLPLIEKGLENDLLVITGGVSAGKVDLVPDMLKKAGVEPVFHKVAMKPGKPLFFGKHGNTLVFGLPGNPVSCLVGCELFVLPALRKMLGGPEPYAAAYLPAVLAAEFRLKSDRTTYFPAWLSRNAAVWKAKPVSWRGSGDLRSICGTDGFVVFPPGDHLYPEGAAVEVMTTRLN
jgi:molybdopterin molybdotransferase